MISIKPVRSLIEFFRKPRPDKIRPHVKNLSIYVAHKRQQKYSVLGSVEFIDEKENTYERDFKAEDLEKLTIEMQEFLFELDQRSKVNSQGE